MKGIIASLSTKVVALKLSPEREKELEFQYYEIMVNILGVEITNALSKYADAPFNDETRNRVWRDIRAVIEFNLGYGNIATQEDADDLMSYYGLRITADFGGDDKVNIFRDYESEQDRAK